MGLKILHDGVITEYAGSKYDPNGYGRMRLKIRTGTGANDVVQYGLGTSVAHSSDARFRANVNGQTYYIGTSSSSSTSSEYVSSSTYYTYTYTSEYPRSSQLTREGTLTTATRTQPARYTYGASYYTGVNSGYTVRTSSHYQTRRAHLSTTVSSQYTAHWTGSYTQVRGYGGVSVTHSAQNRKASFANGSTWYSYTSVAADPAYYGTTALSRSVNGNVYDYAHFTATTTATYNGRTNAQGATIQATYNRSRVWRNQFAGLITTPITASRASNVYVSPPNNLGVDPWGGVVSPSSGNIAVGAGGYVNSYSERFATDGLSANVSFRSIIYQYYTNQQSSSTQRVGNAILTSNALPISGVPSNYTLSAGPSVISSYNSYTYTDNWCTRSYESVYSTSYWTVTSTLTSSNYVSSSVGTTLTSQATTYTEHNFV